MKMLLMTSTLLSILFTQMKHPLAMGLMLLSQTMITCLISGLMHQSFWFQYILFMVFVGGMLVLFIYVTSLASNEMFSLSTKMVVMMIAMMPVMMTINGWTKTNSSENIELYNHTLTDEINTLTSKFYNQPTGGMTILMALYLLMTLIVVVKIINISSGPLRQTK
uniref:NADH-ubiquinone oxidoreductase chain 6 n=1 Tax=Calcaritermes brevicollis TaxID=2942684 RepID=A0A8X8RHH5_9NEOP|nr:NADH dehydrogenase subunit 6 [Calcaritermes emarginicollis]URH17005.1 NADH dehydrogenase subunit 6 [Calcaritermes brevicollis]URX54380.1 NADH dehydrogenase subunit 6 [Calcaritermes brevicollis]